MSLTRKYNYELLLFLLLIAAHLIPVWSFKYFLTNDGPAHLYNAYILKSIGGNTLFSDFFYLNANLEPNYLGHSILAGLMYIFPPFIAEKILLSLYIIGLPLSFRLLVKRVNANAGFISFLVFPFVYSVVLQYGFYNFCISLCLYFLLAAYWLKHKEQLDIKRFAVLLLLFTLLYFSHPVSYLLGAMTLGLLILEDTFLKPPRPGTTRTRFFIYHSVFVLLAFLPSLALLFMYFQDKGTGTSLPVTDHLGQVVSLLRLDAISFMGYAEKSYRIIIGIILLALTSVALIHYTIRRNNSFIAFIVIAFVLVIIYIFFPDGISGGTILKPRIGLYFFLILMVWIASRDINYPVLYRRIILSCIVLVSALLLVFRYGQYRTVQSGLDEYLSVTDKIREGSILLPVQLTHVKKMPDGKEFHSYIDVFTHCSNYISIERNLVDLENYEAYTGYFPLIWKPAAHPSSLISCTDTLPCRVNIPDYEQQVNRKVDYVLTWGTGEGTGNDIHLKQQLDSLYRLTYTSPNNLLMLYERK
jgi:hypothetical protein